MTLIISNSELRAMQLCPRRWYLAFYRGWQRKNELPTGVVHIGSHIHLALEGYYGYELDPLQVLRWSYGEVIAQRPEHESQLRKDLDLAEAMVDGYLSWAAAEGIDVTYEVIATEHEVTHPVTLPSGAQVVFRAKLDQLVKRRDDGRLLFRDWKPQPLTEKVLTPDGWVQMGDLRPGDVITDHQGEHRKVLAVHDRGLDDVFKITMSDGTSVRATADHPWLGTRYHGQSPRVITTAELKKGNRLVKFTPQQDDADADLPLDPYLLGAWIANGDRWGHGICDGVPESLEATGLKVTSSQRPGRQVIYSAALTPAVKKTLTDLKLMGTYSIDRFIPHQYLHGASYRQRLALLHGLMDGDGCFSVKYRSTAHYSTISPQLMEDVAELVRSLGGFAKTWVNPQPKYNGTIERSVLVRTSFNPFLRITHAIEWERKRAEVTAKAGGGQGKHGSLTEDKIIRSVEPDGREAVRCIQVDSDDHLYVTSGHTVTHNTVGGFEKANALLLDQQMRFYAMLQALVHRDSRSRIDGALYVMLKRSKRTARATGPFYQQVEISYNRHDLNSTYLRALSVAERIIQARRHLDGTLETQYGADHRFTCPPNSSDFCTWGCQYFQVCPLFDDGSRVADALADQYEIVEPYHYYDTERIQRAVAALGSSSSAWPPAALPPGKIKQR